MRAVTSDHDRAPAGPDRDTTLAAMLSRMHLQGAVFLRGEYTEAWAYRAPSPELTAAMLSPGSDRVALFHLIATGHCWTALPGGERHWARAGDVVVCPYGDVHVMGGTDDTDVVALEDLLSPPPWHRTPVITLGAGGQRTDVVCGYLSSDHPLFDHRLRALPSLFVASLAAGPARDWVQPSLGYALAQTTPSAAGGLQSPTQLPELVVREVLRLHLESAPSIDSGWVSALGDPVLAPALAALHGSPQQHWDVPRLAREALVSTSVLDERFRRLLGLPPIRYLALWRMHIASDLLGSTTLSVAAIARQVGYDSEEAFSRAFKRHTGRSPRDSRLR